jgi:hypothetical protein
VSEESPTSPSIPSAAPLIVNAPLPEPQQPGDFKVKSRRLEIARASRTMPPPDLEAAAQPVIQSAQEPASPQSEGAEDFDGALPAHSTPRDGTPAESPEQGGAQDQSDLGLIRRDS